MHDVVSTRLHINKAKAVLKVTNLLLSVTTSSTNIIDAKKVEEVETTPSLTQAGRPIGGDLVSHGANALEAAISVDTLTSMAQQGVPFTLVNV